MTTTHLCVVSFGKRRDEVVRIGLLGRLYHIRPADARARLQPTEDMVLNNPEQVQIISFTIWSEGAKPS